MSQELEQKFVEINRCIYCGGIGETDEHVLPLALGGEMLLRKASCEPCRKLTSHCEYGLLKYNLASARACLNYPSRRRDFDNETFPLGVTLIDGTKTTLNLSNRETLGIVQFIELSLPGYFTPSSYVSGSNVCGISTIGFGLDLREFIERYGIKQISTTAEFRYNYFERMVARIAYCYVITFLGLDCLEECYVLPAVLGTKDDVGMWVGCDPQGRYSPPIGKQPGRNAMKLAIFRRDGSNERSVLVKLKFFAASDAPEYLVVVGRLRRDFDPRTLE